MPAGRPPKPPFALPTLTERHRMAEAAGLRTRYLRGSGPDTTADNLGSRVEQILAWLEGHPIRTDNDMMYLAMYDISDDKIRLNVAKYLKAKGMIRIQKSVWLGSSDRREFAEIGSTLRDINAAYKNMDSIVMLPVTTETMAGMHLIGANADFQMVTKPPKVLII